MWLFDFLEKDSMNEKLRLLTGLCAGPWPGTVVSSCWVTFEVESPRLAAVNNIGFLTCIHLIVSALAV